MRDFENEYLELQNKIASHPMFTSVQTQLKLIEAFEMPEKKIDANIIHVSITGSAE